MTAPGSLNARPREARLFYATIALLLLCAVAINVLGLNLIRVLVWSSIVQGFSVPPLLLMMLLMTNDRQVVGERVNSRLTKCLAGATNVITTLAALGLLVTWFYRGRAAAKPLPFLNP